MAGDEVHDRSRVVGGEAGEGPGRGMGEVRVGHDRPHHPVPPAPRDPCGRGRIEPARVVDDGVAMAAGPGAPVGGGGALVAGLAGAASGVVGLPGRVRKRLTRHSLAA
jgi:hypothetical protein